MLNIGLIGDIKLLGPYIQIAQRHPEVHITGKSSVGTQPSPASFRLQAPEFNRIELIERSDALFINRFSLLPYSLICDMIKRSKHIFAASYPDLEANQIQQLIKLANEAKTVVQVINPFYYLQGMQWLGQNLKKPACIHLSYFNKDASEKNLLLQILLMLKDLTGTIPKKSRTVAFRSVPANSEFHNIQLDFNDGSTLNLNKGIMDKKSSFTANFYMRDLFGEFDFLQNQYVINNRHLESSDMVTTNEADDFLDAVFTSKKVETSLEDYTNALHIFNTIQEKLTRYH